jgi:nicotinamidase/pyrazinamidase
MAMTATIHSKIELQPTDALLIVDMQRDFCPGGRFAVAGGDEIVPVLNELVERATAAGAQVVASRDWRPPNHSSFRSSGGPWPQHCVRGTEGAKFHPQLRLPASALLVSKAKRAEREQISCFDNTGLAEELRLRGVDRIWIGGLAEELCVSASAIDAARLGFETHVLLCATRAATPEGAQRARAEMRAAGVVLEAP